MPKCASRLGWMALGAFITWFAITMLHFHEKTSLMEFSSHHIPTVKGRHSTVTVRPAGTSARAASNDLRIENAIKEEIEAATKEAAAEVKAAPGEPKVAAPEERAAAPSSSKLKAKKEQVVNSMREIWRNYKAHAWGYDELKPQSQQGYSPRGRAKCSQCALNCGLFRDNNWGGLGMSM